MKNKIVRTGAAEVRAESQRRRIILAAEKCFVNIGLNKASISNISSEAQMSPGLIYRYFDSKSEIVYALIKWRLERILEAMKSAKITNDFAEQLLEDFGNTLDPYVHSEFSPGLLLELFSEATRDTVIKDALDLYDRSLIEAFSLWLQKGISEGGLGFPEDVANFRAEMFQILYSGLKVREVRNSGVSKVRLKELLKEMTKPILSNDLEKIG